MEAELSSRAVKDDNGNVSYLEGFVNDVSEQKKSERALKQTESRYRIISENTGDVIWIMNIESNQFTYVSPSVYNLRGYKPEEFLNQSVKDVMTQESYKYISENLQSRIDAFLSGDESMRVMTSEVDQPCKDGSIVPTEVVTTLLVNDEGQVKEILGVTRDIRERKKMEESLIKSEEKYRTLFELDPDYTLLLDTDGIIVDVNNAATSITGKSRNEIVGKPLNESGIIILEDIEKQREKLAIILEKNDIQSFEVRIMDKNGNIRWVNVKITTIKRNDNVFFILIIASDITATKQFEKELKDSIREKEVLLQEIHHRVKNNMQIISSLMNIQTRYLDDEESINVLKESQNRVKSMAIIHEKLYRSKDFSKIYFIDYIENLVWDLFYSYSVKKGTIEPVLDIDDIKLNIETSVPCGLIITELVSNSLKYAFPDNQNGEIFVSLKIRGDEYELIIRDNGIGFPDNIDFRSTDSLGLQLVNSLTDQIDGKIEMKNDNGTEFKIIFKELIYKERL